MDKGFQKFKQKTRISAILRSLLVGLSLGVMAFALPWLLFKLLTDQADVMTYALIGGGVALVATGIMLAILMPTDKRLAKKLDTKLNLGEKIQTMVAFRNDDNEMVQLQRENAEEILAQTPIKSIRNKYAWLIAILPVLACGCMVGSILVNAQEPPAPKPPVDTGWYLNPYDDQKLTDLITYVRTSNMDTTPKETVVTLLENLQKQLKNIKKEGLMKDTVVSCIDRIHEVVSEHNTYDLITDQTQKIPSEHVKLLGSAIGSLNADNISERYTSLTTAVSGDAKTAEATTIAAGIAQALGASSVDPQNDLYAAMKALEETLKTITEDMTAEEVGERMEPHRAALQKAVKQPKINEDVEIYTINKLMEIFGVESDKISSDILDHFGEENVSKPSEPDDDEGKESDGGGLGDGLHKFGSDDTVYDPETEEHVPFGNIYQRFEQIILEYQIGGTVPEDLYDALTAYLEALTDYAGNKSGN